MERSEEIADTVRRYLQAWRAGDADIAADFFSIDPDASWFGASEESFFRGAEMRAIVRRQLADLAGRQSLGPDDTQAWREYGIGWFVSRLRFRFSDHPERAARMTGVVRLEDGRWRCISGQMSLAGDLGVTITTSVADIADAVEAERPSMAAAAAPDGTVTIMFSDIESSTMMTEQLGDRVWMEMLRRHNQIVRNQVAANRGFEVKAQGDGFMVAFASARDAVHAAQGIQRALAEGEVRVRIGLHSGEAIREADDFFGKTVILAARIAARAQGGQILASALVHGLVESSGEFAFGDAQEAELKGLAGTHRMYEIRW